MVCKFKGFHNIMVEAYVLLGYDNVSLTNQFLVFWTTECLTFKNPQFPEECQTRPVEGHL